MKNNDRQIRFFTYRGAKRKSVNGKKRKNDRIRLPPAFPSRQRGKRNIFSALAAKLFIEGTVSGKEKRGGGKIRITHTPRCLLPTARGGNKSLTCATKLPCPRNEQQKKRREEGNVAWKAF